MENLKAQGLWDEALIIFASDHGNQVPAYQDLYPDRPTTMARLQSHINFIMAGGLVEKALRDLRLPSLRRDSLVSQVDISQFLADTLGLQDFASMGENPFHDRRQLPVLSRLEQHLFDPEARTLMDPSAWQSRPVFDVTAMPDAAARESKERNLLFYRSYIDYISTK
jgi:arylsulfatase A-like enzyme